MASHHLANNTQQGSESPDYHIWDFEEIWQKLTMCADNTITQLKQQQVDLKEIVGISVMDDLAEMKHILYHMKRAILAFYILINRRIVLFLLCLT